jgi:hypothetical protein
MDFRTAVLLRVGLALAGLAAGLAASPDAAALFKCTNAAGKVAYQDEPCPDASRQSRLEAAQGPSSGLKVLTVSLAARRVRDLQGTPVVMVLYSTRCPISKQLIPQLGPVAAQYRARGIAWEVYSTDDAEDFGDVAGFLARNNAPFSAVAIEPWEPGDLTRAMAPLGIEVGSTWTRPLVAVRNAAGRTVGQAEAVSDVAALKRAIESLR